MPPQELRAGVPLSVGLVSERKDHCPSALMPFRGSKEGPGELGPRKLAEVTMRLVLKVPIKTKLESTVFSRLRGSLLGDADRNRKQIRKKKYFLSSPPHPRILVSC